MANQNLSQFTEKTFVADADHTFIWDTAASISKRVSRNSWLNSGTLTSDAPVTISQTWNNAAVAFTGLRFNAAGTSGTNSAAGSILFDLQVGGATKVSVNKDGVIGAYAYNGLNTSGGGAMQVASGNATFGYHMARDYCVTWGGAATLNGSIEVSLCRDGAANTLALRNGANAQTFNIYNTYQTAGVDYERIAFKWSSNIFTIGREFGGTGGSRNIRVIGGGSVIGFGEAPSAAVSWTFSSNNFLAGSDNAYDIGASGANRPRNVYVAQTVRANAFQLNSTSHIYGTVEGVIGLYNNGLSDFNRLQFGGTTNLFPAIKRSTTTLQARLADDSAFAPIQGKLTTDTAYTGTVVAATGYITIYDSTGAAYRVPCAV